MPENTHATKADLELLRKELLQRFDQLREYIDERTRDLQTEVIRAFGNYQQSQDIRFRRLQADTANIDSSTDQRLTALEDRIHNIAKRLIQKGLLISRCLV